MSRLGSRFHRPAGPAAVRFGLVFLVAAVAGGSFGCAVGRSDGTPDAKLHFKRGSDHADADQWDDAIKEYELALKLDHLYVLCSAHLGYAYHKKGFSQRGIECIEDANKPDPDVADCYCNLGDIYFDMKRYADAEKQYKLALDTYAGYDEAHFGLARVYQETNRKDLALAEYVTAAQQNPKFVAAHVAAAQLFFANGVYKDAEQHALLAIEYDKKNPYAHGILAKIAEKNEQWEEAIKKYKVALEGTQGMKAVDVGKALEKETKAQLKALYKKCPPRVAKALVASAREDMADAKKIPDALDDLEAAGQIDPKLIDVPILKAQIYLALKDAKKAEEAIKVGIALEPKNKDVRLTHGLVVMNQGKWKAGEEIFRALRREEPKSPKHHLYLGVCYFKQNYLRRAEREWKEALEYATDEGMVAQLRNNLKELEKKPKWQEANGLNDEGNRFLKEGKAQEAQINFRLACTTDPEFSIAHANWSMAALALGDLVTAEEKAKKSIALDPDVGFAHNNLGAVYMRQGKLKEAKKAFGDAHNAMPWHPDPLYNHGLLAAGEGKDPEAERFFETALELDPKHARAQYQWALLYEKKKLWTKAEERHLLSIRADPKYIEPRVGLARVYLATKRFTESLQAIEEAYKLDPSAPEPWLARAQAQEALGEKKEAQGALTEAAARFAGRGQFAEAVSAARRAVNLDPSDWMAHSDLGGYLISTGAYPEAINELRTADQLTGGQDLRPRFRLGICYEQMKRFDKANETYVEITALAPKFGDAWHRRGLLFRPGATDNPLSKSEAIECLQKAARLPIDPDTKNQIKARIHELQSQ